MKKKIASLITAVLVLIVCVFASACGNRYKNLEFSVYYAFSETAETWFDGTDGISLNYNPNDEVVEGEDVSSLVFDETGKATIYVKVVIKNIKAKYVDTISVTSTAVGGLSLSIDKVKQNQIFTMSVTKDANVNTTLKLYENNSGKKHESSIVISRTLEGIEADADLLPGVTTNGSINLLALNNLTYLPEDKTNQIGVTYSISSIGHYNTIGEYKPIISATNVNTYVKLENGLMRIIDGGFFGENTYAIKVRATSIFHPGDKEKEIEPIYAEFDVYVVENSVADPVVKFYNTKELTIGNELEEKINLYENGEIRNDSNEVVADYSASSIYVDTDLLFESTKYVGVGLKTSGGKDLAYATVVYVLNEYGVYEEYAFDDAKYQAGINGLIIKETYVEEIDKNILTFTIADRANKNNKVKICYEIKGLDFSYSEQPKAEKAFTAVKDVMPSYITVNDSLDLTQGSLQTATVYGTASASYKGLQLKLTANPNDDLTRTLTLLNSENGLVITDAKGNKVDGEIATGSTIFIRFKNNVTETQSLTIKTLRAPTFYNEQAIKAQVINDDVNYLTVSYTINKQVTADKLTFVAEKGGAFGEVGSTYYIDADAEQNIYVKTYYTGVYLDTSTITLKSDNDKVLFNNGTTEILLSAGERVDSGTEGSQKYNIYKLSLQKTNVETTANITVEAGNGMVGVSSQIQVKSVYLMSDDAKAGLSVVAKTESVQAFGDNKFAIAQGEFAEFVVMDANNQTKAISSISVETDKTITATGFSSSAIEFNVISNSLFAVDGVLGGYTQVLEITASFYYLNGNQIAQGSKTIKAQIAVFKAVTSISARATQDTIGYVNPYFEETSSTEVAISSYSKYGTPADVVFIDSTETGVSQLKVDIAMFEVLANSKLVKITYTSTDGSEIILLNNDGSSSILNGQILKYEDGADTKYYLDGKIRIELFGTLTMIDSIQLTIKACRFGVETNVLTNVVISLANVEKADKILVSGENLTATSDVSTELKLSFKNVEDGGYDEKSFNASLQFETTASENSLRFDDIENALTHVLYRYELNAKNEIRISNDFFIVTYENGIINVRAYKNLNGGLFKLVLATKDSFTGETQLSENETEEEHFKTTFVITVRVEDGINAAYSIYDEDDLKTINYNLDKKFVLANNIEVGESFKPIGLIGKVVNKFQGELSGDYATAIGENQTKVTSYSISLTISAPVESTEEGNLYGLFAILGENAIIKNLNLEVLFSSSFAIESSKGLKIGSLSAVNEGTIENVNVSIINSNNVNVSIINSNTVSLSGEQQTSSNIDFGGIVGVNRGSITSSTVENLSEMTIESEANATHNIGLIIGTNSGSITGSYQGKESLNNFVLDVYANLKVYNTTSEVNYYIGSVAGANSGTISNMLVGGQINVTSDLNYQAGAVGGLVGKSSGTDNKISTSAVMGLDINMMKNISVSSNLNVGGIVGDGNATEIDYVKFISIVLEKGGIETTGRIYGSANVGGIVGSSTSATITNSSVESFVETIENKETAPSTFETFYTINGGENAGSLVGSGSASISTSFAHANIKSTGNVYLNGSYFIGEVHKATDVEIDSSNLKSYAANYTLINQSLYKEESLQTLMESVPVDFSTTDWTNIYVLNGSQYEQATEYDSAQTYYQLKVSVFTNIVGGDNWVSDGNYNKTTVNGVEVYLPFIIWDHDGDASTTDDALMIVKPESISASIDQDYVADNSSTYIKDFNYSGYEITESVIVNYFDKLSDEDNAHYFFELIKDGDEIDGLLDVKILPNDPYEAQGGFNYQILGDGYKFAYINDKNQIVFTGASGNIPILVKIYSVFDPSKVIYVSFYSQSLLTELQLSSSALNKVDSEENGYDYEMNIYTGESNKIISMDAENLAGGYYNSTIFDVHTLSQYLIVTSDVSYTNTFGHSLLNISTESYNNITAKIDLGTDGKVATGYTETIAFSLYLSKEYFAGEMTDRDVLIGEIKVKVYLLNAATNIEVIGEDAEISTSDDISFKVKLTTDMTSDGTATKEIKDGKIVIYVQENDGITIELNVQENCQTEVNNLIANVKKAHLQAKVNSFVDLFDVQFSCKKESNGYSYIVSLELVNDHYYRYIKNNIIFNIIVFATNKAEISNEGTGGIEIVMKPAMLTTARIENYAVKDLSVNTDYTELVASGTEQTSIVEPGSLGNVMMIYLEPTYSNIKKVSIKTSELYVPSLGKNVMMKFTQLAYRESKNAFTTLYGGANHEQINDTLELELVTKIKRDGTRVYEGVIYIYIQLEKFGGLEGTLTATLNVQTDENGTTVTRTRDLLTSYLPEVHMSYTGETISDGYMIQKGTSNNVASIKIYGYQFNSNPSIEYNWNLPNGSNYKYVIKDGSEYVVSATATGIIAHKDNIGSDNKVIDTSKLFFIGDYVSTYLMNSYKDIVKDSTDDSYTISLKIRVEENIPASFTIGASLQLTTKDGQLATSEAKDNKLNFYPTNYILTSLEFTNLYNNKKNIALNNSGHLEFGFSTMSTSVDMTDEIYLNLLEYVYNLTISGATIEAKQANLATQIAGLSEEARETAEEKFLKMFTYYDSGTCDFSQTDLHPQFEASLINGDTVSIAGYATFNKFITFSTWFGYKLDNDGNVTTVFGEKGDDDVRTSISSSFVLNIYPVDEQHEIYIYTAEDIYNSTNGTWDLVEGGHYVLMEDIELENVVPITTKIGSFNGNNRVISIKSFKVDAKTSDYGLFANIGTYQVQNQETEEMQTKQTLLKNIIVDYSKFDGTIALNNLESSNVRFGGLVAYNNGGLIYNCDVMNLSYGTDKQINVVVKTGSTITFGGLVAENAGIITNSRVGRDSYTKIIVTKSTSSISNKSAGGLTFNILNKTGGTDEENLFAVTAGGFVGINSGTISSSYLARTNLFNYSTHEKTNITAGFAGTNSGTISYSYAKADDDTITTTNPYATGYVIENTRNGIVAGFVYTNSGTISNSYANLELQTKSAYIAGFVYNNVSGATISECYAATTMNSSSTDSEAEQPFVGISNAGELLSQGTLENTYYLMRSEIDNPYTQGNLDVAQALNTENFQNSEYLVGFSFVLSNSKAERLQGTWSYYTVDNQKRILPELMTADIVAHSHKYVDQENSDSDDQKVNYYYAKEYAEGTFNNPYTISSVEEYNNVFTENGQSKEGNDGYVRFINNISFGNDQTAISTRTNYTLGSTTSETSIEGNGMTISDIYLDTDADVIDKIGLFAEVQNAYIKNLNLVFATPTTDGQFSTTTATYSGGLAGLITDSVIINITLNGENTTLTGASFVGGLAGVITGRSLISGVETNLNVKASNTSANLYYSNSDYTSLKKINKTGLYYNESAYQGAGDKPTSYYINTLSYAGGLAGVLDLTERENVDYNVQFVDIRGDKMQIKTNPSTNLSEANIIASYAGGVAGYANENTNAFKLRYFIGGVESISGSEAVGGLFGVSLGSITASQVTAEETLQYDYDTTIGDYILKLQANYSSNPYDSIEGNSQLLSSNKYAGGLIGVGLNAKVKASYSKASFTSGSDIGGLIGLSFASTINYSYAITKVALNSEMQNVGGLIGSAYSIGTTTRIESSTSTTLDDFEELTMSKGAKDQLTDIQFTYSTVVVDNNQLETIFGKNANLTVDHIVAKYQTEYNNTTVNNIGSNSNSSLVSVYAGTVKYVEEGQNDPYVVNQTKSTSGSQVVELYKLFNVGDPAQTIAFQEVFSGWSLMKYWSLKEEKYFPLLTNESVDNFINIDSGDDIAHIRNNLKGKFRIVDNITIDAVNDNWVIDGLFEGVLLGELEGDNTRPTVTIKGINPTKEDTTGFFQQTLNATISNISFAYESSDNKPAFNLAKTDVTMVSGVSCDDENSLFSNLEVRATVTESNATTKGYILDNTAEDNTDKTITGFGAIVGTATNTNVLGCTFAGKVKATIKGTNNNKAYVGGLVGYSETNQTEGGTSKSSVIINSYVGVSKPKADEFVTDKIYPTTSFDLTISDDNASEVYIGGIVGNTSTASIASSSVGGASYNDDYQTISFAISGNINTNLHIGGVVGSATNGTISSCEARTNFTLTGSATCSNVHVGGLAGDYGVSGATLTSGISKSNAKTTINTYVDSSNLLTSETGCSVMLSTGVAQLSTVATMAQCYFEGKIDTENSSIETLYAGGAVAQVSSGESNIVSLSEVVANAEMYVGSSLTTTLYAGGLIGKANKVDVSYSASWGRVVPITHNGENKTLTLFVGGMIGEIAGEEIKQGSVTINNSYTITNVIADSIAGSALPSLTVGALVGDCSSYVQTVSINKDNVYYSSDLALFTDTHGTNIDAFTMLRSTAWHTDLKTEDGTQNQIWKSISPSASVYRIPYPASLEEVLTSYKVIGKQTGETSVDYVEGSQRRPLEISASHTFNETNYTYFILLNDFSEILSGALNGFLIGQDGTFNIASANLGTKDTYSGLIPEIGKHSVVSNVHVDLGSDKQISQTNTVGIIAGYNQGVIFNSSVQGNGIELTGSGSSVGLIAGVNDGLVSYCFSTAEVLESASTSLAGLVNTNNGKIMSSYFTGYLSSSESAGLVVTSNSGTDDYVYNCYMAGVIGNGKKQNSAFGDANVTGTNNFIDYYSDLDYAYGTQETYLTLAKTADLMGNTGSVTLAGNWNTAVANGVLSTTANNYAHNYNYPVPTFNTLSGSSGTLTNSNDNKHQLYTGTGGTSETSITDSGDISTRYSNVVGNAVIDATKSTETYYDHAFKIPHLGVLSAIHSMLYASTSRNYVLIYDIDGKYGSNYETWNAVGSATANGDFTASGSGFNGVFVSNKNFAYTLETNPGDSYCLVTNLSNNGLFGNITDAYIGNLKLGNFKGLVNSGVLGTNVAGSTTINLIEFVEDSEISGDGTETNYFGGLFGSIENSLTIKEITTGSGTESYIKLNGKGIAGLIAGQMTAGSIEIKTLTDASGNVVLQQLYVQFANNTTAGGLVGDLQAGSIDAYQGTINIFTSGSENGVTSLGGIVGTASGGTISNVTAKLNKELHTQNFGGIVGSVTGTLTLGLNIVLDSQEKSTVTFNGSTGGYFGLIAGSVNGGTIQGDEANNNQNAGVTPVSEPDNGANAGTQDPTQAAVKIQNISTVTIQHGSSASKCGVGVLAGGLISGTINVAVTTSALTIDSTVTNLGGFVGYVGGGATTGSTTGSTISNEVTLHGTTNVGGWYGYVNTAFGNDLKLDHNESITINVGMAEASATSRDYKNIGGIVGKQEGDVVTLESANISIKIGVNGKAENVGGIIGELTGTISAATNNTTINGEVSKPEYSIENTGYDKQFTKLINVGGVVGKLNDGGSITNSINGVEIIGYQNVGGIVGYADKNTTITGNIVLPTEGTDLNLIKYLDGSLTITAPTNADVQGKIYGVINVGGVAGYVGNGATVQQFYSQANVYGNTNVAGLVGLSDNATIQNNYIKCEGEGSGIKGQVKGIYYVYKYQTKSGATVESKQVEFIPTGVGGLVGLASSSTVSYNLLEGVKVTSSEEGVSKYSMISTISNNMANICFDSGTFSFVSSSLYELKNTTTLEYAEIRSGFGGFIGTTNQTTDMETNHIKDIQINAPLGVNVGTYYGVVSGSPSNITMPRLTGSAINVDGAYNVGGVIGYLDSGTGNTYTFKSVNNSNLTGSATINLQSNITGLYVGGLLGKTNSNSISELNIQSDLTTEGKKVNIFIHTDNCYYAGGLIGRAEVSDDATISGNIGIWSKPEGSDEETQSNADIIAKKPTNNTTTQDTAENLGGLIGMLKVGENSDGITVTVSGKHKFPFTINTIENSNYADGDSRFNSSLDKQTSDLTLSAEAYYINLDTFNVDGSSDTTLYDNDSDTNPFNSLAKGWHKTYTGFKQMQRFIPKNKNNGADWHSIAVLYDAASITHVGTIENLGMSEDKGVCNKTDSSEDGVGATDPTGNPDGLSDNIFRVNPQTECSVEGASCNNDGYAFLPMDYIVFTIYDKGDGKATLYSPIGIASQNIESVPVKVSNSLTGFANFFHTIGTYFGASQYNDVKTLTDNGSIVVRTKGNIAYKPSVVLDYKEWNVEPTDETKYVTVLDFVLFGGDEKDSTTYSTVDNNSLCYFTDWGGVRNGYNAGSFTKKYKYLKVKNYLNETYLTKSYAKNGEGEDETHTVTYSQNDTNNKGAFFVFDVIYENGAINGLTYGENDTHNITGKTDNYLPIDGSIFNASGTMSTEVADALDNKSATNILTRLCKVTSVIFWIIISVVTYGLMNPGTFAAIKGIGTAFVKACGAFIKAAWAAGIKGRGFLALITILSALVVKNMVDSRLAYYYYVQPLPNNVSYGFVSSLYSKQMLYEEIDDNVQMVRVKDDVCYNKNGDQYIWYSNDRPDDYHNVEYVGMLLDGIGPYTINSTNDVKFEDLYNVINISQEQTLNIPQENGTTEELEITVGESGGHKYWIAKKYLFEKNSYYIYSLDASMTSQRVTLPFTPETYTQKIGANEVIKEYEKPNWITANGSFYVRGTWDTSVANTSNTKPYIYKNNYPGNNVRYNSDIYSCNGVTISSGATYSGTSFKYVPENSTFGYEGYDRFETAYYTISTSKIDGVDTQYAQFDKLADHVTPTGTEGIHWVKRQVEVECDPYINPDGNLMKLNDGTYVEITDPSYTGDRYKNTEIKTYIYQLDESEGLSTSKGTDSLATIYLEMNPTTFVNPYSNDNFETETGWKYSEDATSDYIEFAPTYFIFDGGYMVANDNVYLPVPVNEKNKQEIDMSIKKNGTWTSVTLDADNYNDYDDYTLYNGKLVSDLYQLNTTDNKLYQLNKNYFIKDGLLHVNILKLEEDKTFDGFYLTNTDVMLYTRYKYTQNGNASNLKGVTWADVNGNSTSYSLVPQQGSTQLFNKCNMTYFSESVRVLMSYSGPGKLYLRDGVELTRTPGSITVQ